MGLDANSSPNLVLLPGLDGTGLLFRPLLAALPADIPVQVIAYPPEVGASLEEYAAFVAGMLPPRDVVLLAESFSGLVALSLLARHCPRVSKVLFVAAFAAPPRPRLLQLSRFLGWSSPALRLVPDFLLRQFCVGRDAAPELVALLREALAAVPPRVLADRLELVAGTQFQGLEIATPCVYLQAQDDRLVPRSAAQWFRGQAACRAVETIKGPHFLVQAQPQATAKWIMSHIDGIAPEARTTA